MLQITEYNISWNCLSKHKHGPLISTERAWASAAGKRSFASLFGNWDEEQKILENLKSAAYFRSIWFNSCNDSFVFGVEKLRRFVNIRLHCIVNSQKGYARYWHCPPRKISADAQWRGAQMKGAIITKVWRSLLYAILLNGASESSS